MVCSGCLQTLCSSLICCYLQGKFNAVDYLPTLFGDNHLGVCFLLCIHTCKIGLVITVRHIKELGRCVCVCVWVCVEKLAKERRNRLHAPYLYFRSCRSCNIQRTYILEFFFFFLPALAYFHSQSFTNTQSHSPCSLTHTRILFRLPAQTQQR